MVAIVTLSAGAFSMISDRSTAEALTQAECLGAGGHYEWPGSVGAGKTANYRIWHSDTAGCSPTNQNLIESGTLDVDRNGNYTAVWDGASTDPQCGRYQFDVRPGSDVRKVLNFHSDCQPAPTDTPAPTLTPTPTQTPTPTPTPYPAPTVDILCDGSNGPCTIPSGSASNLSWTSTNATTCNASLAWSGAKTVSGSQTTGALFSSQTYVITCTGPGGSATDNVTVNVINQNQLSCSPSSQNTTSGQNVSFNATGGTGIYLWTASSGDPSYGIYPTFTTRFFTSTNDETKTVTVQSGNQQSTCTVRVNGASNSSLTINKTVRDISTNSGESENVNANADDTLEFILRVSTFGSNNLTNVRVSDFVPSGLRYIFGSTTVDGVSYGDSITNSLSLGTLSPNRTVVIRFRASVDAGSIPSSGSRVVTNTATASADNTSTVSDPATVTLIAIVVPNNGFISITKFGRNITRGQIAEQSTVNVSANQTVEFLIRVRSTTNTTLQNVIVQDILPVGLTYINNSTSINNIVTANGITGNGINIGALSPNQEALIRFSVTVDPGTTFPNGALSVFNVAQATADNASLASARMTVTRGQTLGVTTVPTGPTDSLWVALVVSLLITAGYATYTKTNLFAQRDAIAGIRRVTQDRSRLNFARFL